MGDHLLHLIVLLMRSDKLEKQKLSGAKSKRKEGRMCQVLQSGHFLNQVPEVVSQPQRQHGKDTVGGAENLGTTTALVVLPYHPVKD